MNITRLIILGFLLLSLVFTAGCGRKTAPVYSEKQSVNSVEKDNNK